MTPYGHVRPWVETMGTMGARCLPWWGVELGLFFALPQRSPHQNDIRRTYHTILVALRPIYICTWYEYNYIILWLIEIIWGYTYIDTYTLKTNQDFLPSRYILATWMTHEAPESIQIAATKSWLLEFRMWCSGKRCISIRLYIYI